MRHLYDFADHFSTCPPWSLRDGSTSTGDGSVGVTSVTLDLDAFVFSGRFVTICYVEMPVSLSFLS
jgi:hypothetical protein